jgi:hypothetical protein
VTSPTVHCYLVVLVPFFVTKHFGWVPYKSSYPFCLPLGSSHVSKLKQQSNGRPMHKEGVLPKLPCPHQLEPSNHTGEPSPCVLQVLLLFGKHPLIYMHVLVCFAVECETVCSQSCVSSWRLSVLPMGGHDEVDATY